MGGAGFNSIFLGILCTSSKLSGVFGVSGFECRVSGFARGSVFGVGFGSGI